MKKFKGLLLAGAAIATVAFSAEKAEAASGQVMDSHRPIVGVWVEVKGGGSGWAKLTRTADQNVVSWSYNTRGRDYQLHVGVDGNPQKWKHNIKTGWISRKKSIANVSTSWNYLSGNMISVR